MLDAHELATIIPDMTPEEYQQLLEDIGANGIHEPITLFEGKILDGRHRYRAFLELSEFGRAPELQTREFTGNTLAAYTYVISMNIHRRHLEFQQRAVLAWEFKEKLEEAGLTGQGKRNDLTSDENVRSGKTAAQISGEFFHVGQTSVKEVGQIAKASPELLEQVRAGGMGLREAQREIKERTRRERHDQMVADSKLPDGKYRVFYADPPWKYGNTMPDGSTMPTDYYPCMDLRSICDIPIREMSNDDAVLFLWVTSPILEESFEVIKAWGFEYKTSFVWDKVKHNMGHYNSVRHELLLVCVRGSCQPDVKKLYDSVVTEERTEHSVKPEIFRQIIDEIYPHGKRIELFARKRVEGWDAYGNELS